MYASNKLTYARQVEHLFSYALLPQSMGDLCVLHLPDSITSPVESPEKIKFALAWSNREDALSSSTLHLPSDGPPAITHSPSASGLSRKHQNIFEIIEKLQHESNMFLQADYLNYIYNEQ